MLNAFTPIFSPRPNGTQFSPELQVIQRENSEIQRQQLQLLKKMTLPIPKPPVFSGNILEYPKWSSAFDALIEENAVKPSHKLYYLGEYTAGKARTMISGLLGLQTEDAYRRAKKILKDRFGDPFKVYETYRQKLRAWPVCSTANELQEFSDFLVMTEETTKTVKYLKEFDNFSAIRELAARLPTQLGTMHAIENIETMKINDLIVSHHDKLVKIDLPKLYTRAQIPARKEQIPRPETAQAWKHLGPIANKIPPYYEDLKIGVLIGNNCVQAIKPREVIPGRPRDPYAIRTALGWGLIGASSPNRESEVDEDIVLSDCFRITTKEIGSEETPA